jgi:tetratricopeptide (TPR) repeat protein
MKAEHRKELMTNTLADQLGHALQNIKEGPSRGTMVFVIVVAVILLLGMVWMFLARSREESESTRWLRWDNLGSPAQLTAFLDDKDAQEHLPGRLARFEEARRLLLEGTRGLGSANRTQATTDLKKAAELYDQLTGECTDRPLLHQQALMGAARAHESLGEYDPARKLYQKLADVYPTTIFGKDAKQQVARLDSKEQQADLEALRKEFNSPPVTTP